MEGLTHANRPPKRCGMQTSPVYAAPSGFDVATSCWHTTMTRTTRKAPRPWPSAPRHLSYTIPRVFEDWGHTFWHLLGGGGGPFETQKCV